MPREGRDRFVVEMVIRDTMSFDQYSRYHSADEAMRISSRQVDEMRMGLLGYGQEPLTATASMIRRKEVRRSKLREIAIRLAMDLCDRLEDAEGWHDPERIEPARHAIGPNVRNWD